jgi:hypothetical protein
MPQPNHDSPISTFRLRRRTPGTFLLVPCQKLGRSIRCHGQLEAAAAQVLAACPLVENIQEQPISIHYAWRDDPSSIRLLDGPPDKAMRRSLRCSYIVPDFLVTMRSGNQRLVEVKPSAKLDRPLTQRKLAVARLFAAKQGWTFHVVTELQLNAGPLLANVRLVSRFRLLAADRTLVTAMQDRIQHGPVAVSDLIDNFGDHVRSAQITATILHLVANGRIDIDPRAGPISDQTLLHPGGAILWDPFDSVWGPSGFSTDASFGSSVRQPTTSSSHTI